MTSLKLIGAGLSPFVRKVRIVLAEKGLAYEHEQLAPFGLSPEYKRKHPLARVPLLETDGRPIPDSSAICAYLEKLQPQPALYPSDPYDYARAVWFEEFADGGLIGGAAPVFQNRVLLPLLLKRPADESLAKKATEETLPPLFDYLERELGDNEYLVGNRFTIADVAVGSILTQFQYGKGEIDAKRWPKLAAYLERVQGRPSFKPLIEQDRAVLKSIGA